MPKKKRSYLENIQLTIFSITYLLSCILLFWLLTFLFTNADIIVIVFATLAFFILSILGWTHLYVLFSIPQRVAGSFDYLKNDISSGKTISVNEFQKELSGFLVKFYNYSFFDVEFSTVKALGQDPSFSSDEVQSSFVWDNVEKQAEKEDNQIKHGKIRINGKPYYSYTTPIYFGREYLGFFMVFSSRRLGNLMLRLLRDLENNFIDDQLKIIMSLDKGKNRR
jgi:hypothetical protein